MVGQQECKEPLELRSDRAKLNPADRYRAQKQRQLWIVRISRFGGGVGCFTPSTPLGVHDPDLRS